jgi:hypothetical protein
LAENSPPATGPVVNVAQSFARVALVAALVALVAAEV